MLVAKVMSASLISAGFVPFGVVSEGSSRPSRAHRSASSSAAAAGERQDANDSKGGEGERLVAHEGLRFRWVNTPLDS